MKAYVSLLPSSAEIHKYVATCVPTAEQALTYMFKDMAKVR